MGPTVVHPRTQSAAFHATAPPPLQETHAGAFGERKRGFFAALEGTCDSATGAEAAAKVCVLREGDVVVFDAAIYHYGSENTSQVGGWAGGQVGGWVGGWVGR
jgi:hypothetical protein